MRKAGSVYNISAADHRT